MQERYVDPYGRYSLTGKDMAGVTLSGFGGFGLATYLTVEHNDRVGAAQDHVIQQENRVTSTIAYIDHPPKHVSAANLKGYEAVLQKIYNNQVNTLVTMLAVEPDVPGFYNDAFDCLSGLLAGIVAGYCLLKSRRWAMYHLLKKRAGAEQEEYLAEIQETDEERAVQEKVDREFWAMKANLDRVPDSFPEMEK